MSENDEHATGGLMAGPPTAAALSAVPSNDPVSASEVAEELGVSVATARDALRALVDDGDLAHRHVKGRAGAIDVWFRPRPDDALALEDRVQEAVETLAVPGASEMMQSWRRDAVREAFEHLQTAGSADPSEIVDAVYATHEAGYDSEAAWWAMVAPRLGRLPGVDAGSDGEPWRFTAESA